MTVEQEALNRLQKIFTNTQDQVEIIDERGDGRHFLVRIKSDTFAGQSSLERQRQIYSALDDLIKKDSIHALRIDLTTQNEETHTTPTAQASNNTNPEHDLHKLTNQSPVMLFVKGDRYLPQCGFSARIMELLDVLNVEYETFDILEDEEVRQELKEYSNWPTYPQLYVEGKFIGGLDITEELYEKKELQKILANHIKA